MTHWLLRLRVQFGRAFHPTHAMLGWALFIGLLGGLSSAGFRWLNMGLKGLMTGQSTNDLVLIAESLSPEMRLLIPTLGGVIAGIALSLGHRIAKGQKPRDYLESISLGDGVISAKTTLPRLLSSLLSISSGASIGREGGMVQLAAMLASEVGQFFKVSRPRLRLLVACGGAAGLASAYNTPLAGALFIAEIVLQTLAIEALGPLIVSAVTATLVVRHWIGMKPIFSAADFSAPVDIDVLPVIGLGILIGILAPLFLIILDGSRKLFQRLRLPPPLSIGLGGLFVGWISISTPEVWGNGHAVVEALFNEPLTLSWVVNILLFKVLATALAVGSGTIGGVFTPSLLIGAATGWLSAVAAHLLIPSLTIDPVIFAALGMGAFLAGTTHAPVMAILMVFEMTLDANLLLPLILVAMTARTISGALHSKSVYSQTMGRHNQLRSAHHLLHIGDIMAAPSHVIDAKASVKDAGQAFLRTTADQLWVIDDQGGYQGHLSLDQLRSDSTTDEPLEDSLVEELLAPSCASLRVNASLADALVIFVESGARILPVTGPDQQLLGEITRHDVLLALEGEAPPSPPLSL